MSVIVPAWIKERREDGIVAILGSEPPADAQPRFIPAAAVESVVESEHEVNGMRFGVLVLRNELCATETRT